MISENDRRAIVWDTIERIAFKPDNHKKWLAVYEKTLHTLWGVDATDVPTLLLSRFTALMLNVACDYHIETASKYSISITNKTAQERCCWTVHADSGFSSKAAFYASNKKYPRQNNDRFLRNDVACVLEGMIFHPRNHAHGDLLGIVPEYNTADTLLSGHEIRLGGGIENAFVFLMHIRYQFCLLSVEVREAEKARLVDLFTAAIAKKKWVVMPPADLFDFKR